MSRSLPLIHLFVILAVGYIGGILLLREMNMETVGIVLKIYDARIISGQEANVLWPILSFLLFFASAIGLALSKKTRFLLLLLGAIKAVLFGLSSSYLLITGMKMITYSIWWFPFQLLSCFLFIAFCALLHPPFYTRKTFSQKLNTRGLIMVLVISTIVFIIEMILFYWFAI